MTEETLNILLVDDHPLVREGLRALLTSLPGMTIVGEADNGEEAVTKAEELQPDIILIDFFLNSAGEAIMRG
jgi:DNA-binding NarL/FixJ family response regulator